jgi:glutamate 5-kinase
VIKVGTRLLTSIGGHSKGERVDQLVEQIAALRKGGLDVVLVSSGAIGAGMMVLGTEKRPASLPRLQAHAAVGQCRLMYLYETACNRRGFHSAQVLLTAEDVKNRERHLNVVSCLDELLSNGVLPVINENDSVSVDEIKFGDNDMLAAMVAMMVRADITILLTTVDGLHERTQTGFGRRLSVVPRITDDVLRMAAGTEDTRLSVGGMATKLQAADYLTRAGESLWIADGTDFGVLARMFAGEDVGTLFLPAKSTRMQGRKRFLAFFSGHSGDIVVDAGAERALCHQGRSLLPSGIVATRGDFRRGDTVAIINASGAELARGVSNYSSTEIMKIRGKHTKEINETLGYDAYDAVVHRDYMVLTR